MNLADVKHILWDWHGVLGLGKLWQKPTTMAEEILAFQESAFREPDVVVDWMRGRVTTESLIEGLPSTLSRTILAEQVYAGHLSNSWINLPLFATVKQLLPTASHSIVTDNVDIFSDYLHADPWVQETFICFTNSADYGTLKKDSNTLLAIACEMARVAPSEALLIDDSAANCRTMNAIGGQSVHIPHWTYR